MADEIQKLQNKILNFRNERDWEKFHKIKDLVLGLTIESSELAELFLWKTDEELDQIDLKKIRHEIADIYIFLNYIAKYYEINLEQAVLEKIELNNQKYPISKFKGSNRKYNDFD